MAKNRFEQVDETQPDAVALELWEEGGRRMGRVTCPAALAPGRLVQDAVSAELPAVEAFRSAVKLANEIKAPVVVLDPAGLWMAEWGELYRDEDAAP